MTTNSENVSDSFEIDESFHNKKQLKVEYLSQLLSCNESPLLKDEEVKEALSKNVYQKGPQKIILSVSKYRLVEFEVNRIEVKEIDERDELYEENKSILKQN